MPAALDEFWQLQCFGQNLIETVQIIFIPRQRLIFFSKSSSVVAGIATS